MVCTRPELGPRSQSTLEYSTSSAGILVYATRFPPLNIQTYISGRPCCGYKRNENAKSEHFT